MKTPVHREGKTVINHKGALGLPDQESCRLTVSHLRSKNRPFSGKGRQGKNRLAFLLALSVMISTHLFAHPQMVKAEEAQQQSIAKTTETFHQRLVKAALARTQSVVIYNPQYFKIPYPGGDVPAHYGVCSDVIIRSYRALGIDLQKEVHQTMGGDRNIAHRRVRVLRKFFARKGANLPISQDPKAYRPGDIVTYYIPESVFSKDHIAIVTDKIGTSGNYMIVHNIGLGPKLDDDLMSWKITGHYRYGS